MRLGNGCAGFSAFGELQQASFACFRSRADVVKEWSDANVARRWLMFCPERRDEKRRPLEPTEFEINSIANNKEKLATVRSRLGDLSWWMRLLSQNIAQRANKEDGEVGKFSQARYRRLGFWMRLRFWRVRRMSI